MLATAPLPEPVLTDVEALRAENAQVKAQIASLIYRLDANEESAELKSQREVANMAFKQAQSEMKTLRGENMKLQKQIAKEPKERRDKLQKLPHEHEALKLEQEALK
jgi:hypothetical protein